MPCRCGIMSTPRDAATTVIAMIEDPRRSTGIEAIAGRRGDRRLLLGRGDLTVALGVPSMDAPAVHAATERIIAAGAGRREGNLRYDRQHGGCRRHEGAWARPPSSSPPTRVSCARRRRRRWRISGPAGRAEPGQALAGTATTQRRRRRCTTQPIRARASPPLRTGGPAGDRVRRRRKSPASTRRSRRRAGRKAGPGTCAARTSWSPTPSPSPAPSCPGRGSLTNTSCCCRAPERRSRSPRPARAETVTGHSLIIMSRPATAASSAAGGEVVRLFTTRSADLAAKCSNAESYAKPHPNIPPFEPWPEPPDGYRIRVLQPRRAGRARPLRPHLPLHHLHGERPRPAVGPARRDEALAAPPRRLRAVLAGAAKAPSSTTCAGPGPRT